MIAPLDGIGAASALVRDALSTLAYLVVGIVAVGSVGFGLWFLLLR